MNWTAQQKIRLGFWLLTLVPIIFGALAARNAYDLVSASRNIAVTNEVGRRLERLLSELKDIEVAQREFILIGGSQPLQTIADTRARALRRTPVFCVQPAPMRDGWVCSTS